MSAHDRAPLFSRRRVEVVSVVVVGVVAVLIASCAPARVTPHLVGVVREGQGDFDHDALAVTYDDAGRVSTVTSGNSDGVRYELTWDGAALTDAKMRGVSNGEVTGHLVFTPGYDGFGRLATMTEAGDIKGLVTLSYDAGGHVSAIAQKNDDFSEDTDLTYDGDVLASVRERFESSPDPSSENAFDIVVADARATIVTHTQVDALVTTSTVTYDALGRVAEVETPAQGDAGPRRGVFVYDEAGRLAQVFVAFAGVIAESFTFSYEDGADCGLDLVPARLFTDLDLPAHLFDVDGRVTPRDAAAVTLRLAGLAW